MPDKEARRGSLISVFLPLLLLFAVTRFAGLMTQPAWNDEPLYIDYMQLQAFDLEHYRWLSMQKAGEWKPPLQFWVGSRFINMVNDPLLGGRLVSAAVAMFGFAAALWLAFSLSGSAPFALLFGAFMLASPFQVMHDKVALTEAFVYSLGYLYLAAAWGGWRCARGGHRAGAALLVAALPFLGLLLLLTKQSGELYMLYAFFLVAAAKLKERDTTWRMLGMMALALGLSWIAAKLAYKWAIPPELYARKDAFASAVGITLSPGELRSFPVRQWLANAHAALILAPWQNFGAWGMAALAAAAIYARGLLKRHWPIAASLAAAAVLANLPPIVLLKWPRLKYFGAASSYLWFALAAIILLLAAQRAAERRTLKSATAAALALFALAAAPQLYNLRYFVIGGWDGGKIMGDFHELKQCLRERNCPWWTPINVDKALSYLVAENRAGAKGALFIDPQWGHPGSYIKLYQHYFPNIGIAGLTDPAIFAHLPQVLEAARTEGGKEYVYLLFNGLRDWGDWPPGAPKGWARDFYLSGKCRGMTVIDQFSSQSNIVICKYATAPEAVKGLE